MASIIIQGAASAIGAGETGSLGNNTKSSPPPNSYDGLAARYRLQSAAGYIAIKEAEKAGLLPYEWHRVSKCHHCRIKPKVTITKSHRDQKSFYTGVAACGSVWACPVCASKIQNRRREEITAIMAWAYSNGYECHMVTLTNTHSRKDALPDLLEAQKGHLAKLRKGGAFTKYLKSIDYQGIIRTLEVTHGRNGWHVHTHELWIVKSTTSKRDFMSRVQGKWIRALGHDPDSNTMEVARLKKHSVDIHFNAHDSEYLAKMDSDAYLKSSTGADLELSRQSTKKGKAHGRHPFQILADFDETRTKRDALLFVEYVKSFKGKAQIFFSRGLKAKSGLNDVSDQLIADTDPELEDIHVMEIHRFDWDDFITVKKLRAEILHIANLGGKEAVLDFMAANGCGVIRDHLLYYDPEIPCLTDPDF